MNGTRLRGNSSRGIELKDATAFAKATAVTKGAKVGGVFFAAFV